MTAWRGLMTRKADYGALKAHPAQHGDSDSQALGRPAAAGSALFRPPV